MMLNQKTAIVTGGTRGIGFAVCHTFLQEGARVVFTGRDERRVDAATRDLGGEALGLVCDGSDERAVAEAMARALDTFGRVDVLVNNAGIARDAMLHRMTLQQLREVIDSNLQAPWLWCRAALGHMRSREGGGSIVNISSISGKVGNAGQSNYAAAKAGVIALTKVVAREGARFGVRSNAIRPGLITTDMTSGIPDQTRDEMLTAIPLGRPGLPEEVAQAALFLASDMASYVTGAVLDVAGGRHM